MPWSAATRVSISPAERRRAMRSTKVADSISLYAPANPQPAKRGTFGELLGSDLRALPVVIGLVALWIFFAFQSDVFLTSQNLSNLLLQSTVVGVMALGLMFVLLVKEIDLSVAAVNCINKVLMAKLLLEFDFSHWKAVGLAIVAGAMMGFLSACWMTFDGVSLVVLT